jgi:hypothetical protein
MERRAAERVADEAAVAGHREYDNGCRGGNQRGVGCPSIMGIMAFAELTAHQERMLRVVAHPRLVAPLTARSAGGLEFRFAVQADVVMVTKCNHKQACVHNGDFYA